MPLGDVVRLPYEGYLGAGTADLDRYAAMVEDPTGGADAPAAFIVETVQGEGGLNVASPAWLRHLAATAKRLGALLIVDDIQAGCGRTGDFFSFEAAGISPDLVCLAKSIGGSGLPMALLLIKPDNDQWSPGEHNGTFRGNNLAFVAAAAALEFWRDGDFTAQAAASADLVRAWIGQMEQTWGPRVQAKGRGLMSGLSFADHHAARRVATEAFRRKVVIETSGPNAEVVKLLPPLTIEPDLLAEGLQRLAGAIAGRAGAGSPAPGGVMRPGSGGVAPPSIEGARNAHPPKAYACACAIFFTSSTTERRSLRSPISENASTRWNACGSEMRSRTLRAVVGLPASLPSKKSITWTPRMRAIMNSLPHPMRLTPFSYFWTC